MSTQFSIAAAEDLLSKQTGRFGTILADPPWRFSNRTGKMAPEYRRLARYQTMSFDEIAELPVTQLALPKSHLYLWIPNALILQGLEIMRRWGFTYKTNLVWYKIRKDGGPDGRGVGFYFRNVTELVLFGIRGSIRTHSPGRRQVNIIATRKREHSRKPDELYDVIERCSPGPHLELFARHSRSGWFQWGNEITPTMQTHHANGNGSNYHEHAEKEPLLLDRWASRAADGNGWFLKSPSRMNTSKDARSRRHTKSTYQNDPWLGVQGSGLRANPPRASSPQPRARAPDGLSVRRSK